MSDIEKEIDLGSTEDNDIYKEDVNHSFDTDLKDLPEVLVFIKRLQNCIVRQRRIILKLYEKNHDEVISDSKYEYTKNLCDASTQTCDDDFKKEPQDPCVVDDSSGVETKSIVDEVKEIAESAVRQTGFVYEASSGMYYDYNTGYYYNAELGLYYDGNSGSYFTYDENTKTFNYHSSVGNSVVNQNELANTYQCVENAVSNEELTDNNALPKIITSNDVDKMDVEEGECSDDDNVDKDNIAVNDGIRSTEDEGGGDGVKLIENDNQSKTDVIHLNRINIIKGPNLFTSEITPSSIFDLDELANGWPPCMRVVVQETGLDNLTVGTLFIVTCNGGTLGREGNHSITIPDITISKHHASIKFCEEKKCYVIVDLGSRNGTFLNGNRLSVASQESPPHPIEHGHILRVGSTHLLCHVHEGRETCVQCEPGCMVPAKPDKGEALNENKLVRHRSELRRLRRKFGLEGPGAGIRVTTVNSSNYQDRAEARRKTVGSSDDSEKTEAASVYQSIKSDNKGFKMLSKMGWSEGQALGKDSDSLTAITEPIIVEQRPEKSGLGSLEASLSTLDNSNTKRKNTIWKKTLKRFNDTNMD